MAFAWQVATRALRRRDYVKQDAAICRLGSWFASLSNSCIQRTETNSRVSEQNVRVPQPDPGLDSVLDGAPPTLARAATFFLNDYVAGQGWPLAWAFAVRTRSFPRVCADYDNFRSTLQQSTVSRTMSFFEIEVSKSGEQLCLFFAIYLVAQLLLSFIYPGSR
ncbi:hypothetical protein BC832DRAFT_304610 [Gaertneriomyces semiglobifer]|nr:hypothetical protein BC832DRAFT_304610 [Gaertneriomyces semiglobifer]